MASLIEKRWAYLWRTDDASSGVLARLYASLSSCSRRSLLKRFHLMKATLTSFYICTECHLLVSNYLSVGLNASSPYRGAGVS